MVSEVSFRDFLDFEVIYLLRGWLVWLCYYLVKFICRVVGIEVVVFRVFLGIYS